MGGTNIVAVRVLNERQRIVGDFIHELDTLVVRSMIDAALQDTAPMAVGSDLDAVGCHCIVNELPEER